MRTGTARRKLVVALFAALISSPTAGAQPAPENVHEDSVPDERTAIAIAEAVARGQLGEAQLSQILPFQVYFDGEVWRLTSRIGLGGDAQGKGGFRGVTVDIRRNNGEIIFYGYYPFD